MIPLLLLHMITFYYSIYLHYLFFFHSPAYLAKCLHDKALAKNFWTEFILVVLHKSVSLL